MKPLSAAPPLLGFLLAATPEPLDAQLMEVAKLKASDWDFLADLHSLATPSSMPC